MRLHRLAITAFGPFSGSEEVDLDALASSGLFLIHGPTGAGKTSILDAICFALYAAVPGARAGTRLRLRSDHAAEGVVPQVTLEFTASRRRLRVCRSPEFSRAKKRGTGQTTVPATVVLDELVGADWVNRGTRNDEVAMVLRDILGMGLEQFITVVLLPQGDFAAFLRASPEDRRAVLEKLFDTQRFTDVEAWLAERRRQTSTAVGAARDTLNTGLVRVDDVIARLDPGDDLVVPDWSEALLQNLDTVPLDAAPNLGATLDLDTTPHLDMTHDVATILSGLVEAVDLRAGSALAAVEVAQSVVVRTESAVHDGTAVRRHQQTAAAARSRLEALDEQHEAYQEATDRVDLADRAGAVSGFVAAVLSSNLTWEAALTQVADLRVPLSAVLERAEAMERNAKPHPGRGSEHDSEHDSEQDSEQDSEHGSEHDRLLGSWQGSRHGNEHVTDATLVHLLVDQVAAQGDALQQAVAQSRSGLILAQESARQSQAAKVAEGESVLLTQKREESEVRWVAAEQARDAGREAESEIPALRSGHKTLTRISQLLDEQERSAANLGVLQQRAGRAHEQVLDTRERLLNLRERRLAGMAAELASDLGAGDPCPVCGSCVHPTPAQTTDPVSPGDLRSAEADQTRAAEAHSRITLEISAEQAGREARSAELLTHGESLLSPVWDGTEGSVTAAAEVIEALSASEAVISAAQAKASALPEAQQKMEALALEMERLRGLGEASVAARASALALAATSRAQSQTAAAEVVALLASHGQRCPCYPAEQSVAVELGESEGVLAGHNRALTHLRSLSTGLHELLTHRATARDAGLRLAVALQAQGFESMEQAQAASLPAARAAELRTLLRASDQERDQAMALLAQPDVVAALKVPSPDVDALVQTHTQAAISLAEAGRQHTLSEQAQRELRALSGTVHGALADLGPAQAEARLVQELAECVSGNSADNALRMRLSSYVLAARLAEIATLANERLTTMSDGRYTLEYTDARAARGARSGLGLLVRDAWTGQPRETSSLSGGEAFMASLALALGMGDAVRAEAGGFDLQTLFVDEGFGSLDEESLEQVMAVLDTLREGGRAVGIVSHVSELRTRIPHQLQVLKLQAGSRIQTVAGDVPVNRNSPAA